MNDQIFNEIKNDIENLSSIAEDNENTVKGAIDYSKEDWDNNISEETKEIDGFLSAWEFDDILFFEHFAVSSKVRNGGIGGRMLREVLAKVNKMTCLEVELPEGELEKRRISFYERNGFCYNSYPYTQPTSVLCIPGSLPSAVAGIITDLP